jgi:hypothetical protein
MAPITDRHQFREVLATLVAKTQTKIPALNGRVEKACKLVLSGDVELHADGTALVHSLSDPTRAYQVAPGLCQCRDYAQAPEHLCCHRLAAGFARKLAELLPATQALEPAPGPQTLPEAPASVNCHITLEGRQVQITLRDTNETRLLQRLTALLQQYPVPAPPATQGPSQGHGKGWCSKHNVQMKLHQKEGRSWFSHRLPEGGYCKGR